MNETIQKEIAFLESLLAELYFKVFGLGNGNLDRDKYIFLQDLNYGLRTSLWNYDKYLPHGMIKHYLDYKYYRTNAALPGKIMEEFKKSTIRFIVFDEYNKKFILS